MRFYVICKSNQQERIYVSSEKQPIKRSDIPLAFDLKCRNGQINTYTNKDVFAEIGIEHLVGGLLCGLLFLIDFILGLIGAVTTAFGKGIKETEKVNQFNNS